MLPSCGVTLEYWKFQNSLAIKYKLIKIDIAGIGKSGRTREEYTYQSLAEDVKAVIVKEQLDNTVILSYDQGELLLSKLLIL